MDDSPCNNICMPDAESGLCISCGRTQEEIEKWSIYSNEQKKQVLLDIEARNKNC